MPVSLRATALGRAVGRLWHDRTTTVFALGLVSLGLGANIAMFALVDGVLLHPLGYSAPRQLVSIREVIPSVSRQFPTLPVNYRSFDAWRRSRSFSGFSLVHPASLVMTGRGPARQITVDQVSANLLSLLGVTPARGRDFAPGTDAPGRNHEIILTDAFWRAQFGGDDSVLGRTIELNGQACQIIGVLPASFQFLRGADWGTFVAAAGGADLPQALQPFGLDTAGQEVIGNFDFAVIGRLRAGVAPDAARSELNLITARLVATANQPGIQVRTQLTGLRDQAIGGAGRTLWLLFAAVAAVLLLMILNLATLLLARTQARAPEAALRLALGASRARLMMAAVWEGLALGCASAVLGLGLAALALHGLAPSLSGALPRLTEVHLGWPSAAFAFGVALATTLSFSLWPAWRWARTDPQIALKGAGIGTLSGSSAGARPVLVAGQVALTAMLLVTAGLLLRSFLRMAAIAPGYSAVPKLVVTTDLAGTDTVRRSFWDALPARVESLPGVAHAALTSEIPLQGTGVTSVVYLDRDRRPDAQRPVANFQFISPGYFATMGIPLRGRGLLPSDETPNARPVAVISQTTAKRVWPGQDPIGQSFRYGGATGELITIVGVADDVRTDLLRPPGPMVFQPLSEDLRRQIAYLVVRPASAASLPAVAAVVRQTIAAVQPEAAVPAIRTMGAVRAAVVARQQFELELALIFGGCALLLASLGIYGVVIYTVTKRRRELGIRLALGAAPGALARWTFVHGLAPALVGLAAGLLAAFALAPALAAQLYGIHARDGATFLFSGICLLSVAALACALPARRAAHADPLVALRAE